MTHQPVKHPATLVLCAALLLACGLALDAAAKPVIKPYVPSNFQLELYGGLAFINPGDLNQLATYENASNKFFYDDMYAFLKQYSYYNYSWSKSSTATAGTIGSGMPFGIRLRYLISPTLSVSLGVQYMSRTTADNFNVIYTSYPDPWELNAEKLSYAPFSISATAFSPLLGIQMRQPLNKKITLGLFANGGPLLATCRLDSNRGYTWTYIENTVDGRVYHVLYDSTRQLTMNGSGTGLTLEAGARLDYSFSKRLGVFCDCGYAYQAVQSLSGWGSEKLPDSGSQWYGTWAMKRETIKTYWGTLDVVVPSNYWPAGKNWTKTRDFVLDLSGWQARIGLFWRI